MSTYATLDRPQESTAETELEDDIGPAIESDSTDQADQTDPAPIAPFDAHNSAASFDSETSQRLPNTVDGENEYLG